MKERHCEKNIIDMAESPAYKTLFQLSWPVILSLFIQGLYGIVDSVYLSRLGEEVLSAASLASVIINLETAFLTGIATGMNAVISRALGAGEGARAHKTVLSGIFIQGILVLCFICCGVWGVPTYFMYSTSDATVITHGTAYLRPLLVLSVAAAAQITFERLLQAAGSVRYMLYSQLIGTVINIVLDYALIFGKWGFPAMGVAGAAYATVIGQIAATCVALYFNIKKNGVLFGTENNRLGYHRSSLSNWNSGCNNGNYGSVRKLLYQLVTDQFR